MQKTDEEVDFSKISFRNNYSNTNLTIYADIENSKNSSGARFQDKKSLATRITPKSVVECITGKLKILQASDSLKSRLRTQRSLPGYSKSHQNVNSTNKPVYAANKFETQDISASQLVKAIDNAEELQNVASKGYTQEFEVSFQVENVNVCSVELETDDGPEFINSDLNNLRVDELKLSHNSNNLSNTPAETESIDDPCLSTNIESNNIEKLEMFTNKTKDYNACNMNLKNSLNNNDTNKSQLEADFRINNNTNIDSKMLNETYCIAKKQSPDFCLNKYLLDAKKVNEEKNYTNDPNINELQEKDIKDSFFVTEITPSPVFSIATKRETVLSPHIVCNLDDFERFEQLAVSFKEACTDENENNEVYSQILGGNDKIKGSSDKYSEISSIKYKEDIVESSDSLREEDKAQLENIFYSNDSSNDLNISPVLPIQTKKLKFNTEVKTSQSFSDMELTCKDTVVNIINNQIINNSNTKNHNIDEKEDVLKQKANVFLEDDILFSSDEENEYIHKESDELPLTCALETSFYTNQSDVLDKTMLVGFQTASSNQYISIHRDSFSKAKSMMDEVDGNLSPSLIELVDMCEKSAIENHSHDNAEITHLNNSVIVTTKECEDKSENESSNMIGANESTTKCNSIGFKTASNKNINLSEKSRQRILQVFQDIDLTDDFFKEDNSAIPDGRQQTHENNDLNKEICDLTGPYDLFTEIEFTDTEMIALDEVEREKIEPSSKFNGFITGSNKAIRVSENALQMSKKVFENIDNNEESKKVVLNTENQISIDDYVFKKPESPMPKIKNIVAGFKTESIKTLNVSNDALKMSIEMIDINTDMKTEIEFPRSKDQQDFKSQNVCGFQSASNGKLVISEETIEKSRNMFQDIEINCDISSKLYKQTINKIMVSSPSSVYFKTANNKSIQISNKTLEKCRKFFENIDNLDEIIPKTNNNLIKNELAVNPDKEKSSNTANDLEEETQFVGFQTASSKRINISKQSLNKTKHIFDDLKEFELTTYDTNSKKQAAVYDDNLIVKNTKNLIEKTPEFIGFQTASNKMIHVSERLLEKTKHIFSNIDDIKDNDKNNEFSRKEKQLKNAIDDGKNLAHTSTINILENTANDDRSTDKNLKRWFQGFQTASNKKVKVSVESLAKTRDIFNDIIKDNEQENSSKLEVEFKGFQTASKKKIVVSKDALAKTKDFFQDLPENIENIVKSNNSTTTKFAGFQTSNKGSISVSEEALKNSKKIFDNIGNIEFVNPKSESSTTTTPKFAGFQTGSKKVIPISEVALKNSKKIFDNIQGEKIVCNIDTANVKPSESFAFCFQNANQKDIHVSQKAIDAIRKDERNSSRLNIKTSEKPKVNETISYLDTQAISNFENTLFTDEICKESNPIQPKRSASPILSCPRAKKRKSFQTPYKIEKAANKPKAIVKEITTNVESNKVKEITAHTVYEFNNNNYKKNKTVNLKMLLKLEQESKNKSKKDIKITEINFETILNFKFKDKRNDLLISKLDSSLTVEDIRRLFLESIDKKIVPEGWIENHLKLILWKLLSYEIKFPKILHSVCTAKNVIDQLKYRYDRELYNVERPPLRKILEKDELASKCMVLCVVNFIQDGVIVGSITDINKTIELTVTDGWYFVKASIDKMLSKLVYDGRIVVGCKIITHGAELVNCDQGKSPLEDISEVRLKIFGNSTRLVRWHTKLGLYASAAILNRLSNVKVNGGKVSKLRLFVTRVCPMLYVEKFDDGSTVTRSERLEQQYQNKYELQKQNLMEKLYEEIEKELTDEDSQDSVEYKEPLSKRTCLESGSQIASAMRKCKDPVEFRSNLTESQVQLLNEHTNKHRDRILQQIQTKIQEKMEKSGANCIRNVVPLLKVRVADLCVRNEAVEVCQGYISIWRPNEAVSEIITEGEWIDVLNALPTAFRSHELQLTAGRQTVFSKITPKLDEKISLHTKKLLRHCKEIKDLVKNPNEQIDYNEIDTLGIVTEIDPPNLNFETSGRQFQNVYLADLEKNIICINFWGGIKKFGYENILDTGQFIYGRNLQKRVGNTRKSIPQFRVTEFTMFTKTPKNIIQRNLIENFVKNFSNIDRKQFCMDCSLIRRSHECNKFLRNTENISPFRMNHSDYNISKNRQYFESPLIHNNKKEDELRLTGLDFESTFKQTDTQNMSPELLKKKQIAQAKIAKLKMYGEPPPLSPILILNKSKNATAAFKSPFRDSNKSIPTVSPKTTKEFLLPMVENRSSSPVFGLNETYTKKCLNPVKLNFNENVDHFAEDFDGSPPLSLD